ncbi:hypothetical protein RCC89_01395 [Cytophagaceae bacterium ABcell3]|nr:hypothetical protein RCC89_01395 [Cytophagaceae bacterium ABcell3]
MNSELTNIFSGRAEVYHKKSSRLRAKSRKVAIVRLVFFLVSIVAIFVFINDRLLEYAIAGFSLFLLVFVLLVRYHKKLNDKQRFFASLEQINNNELQLINHNPSVNPDGERFIDDAHPYTSDLDIFGSGSLFQFLCRTHGHGGQDTLANYLKSPASQEEVSLRQAAVKELKDKVDWRQKFQAVTFSTPKDHNPQKLWQWIAEDPFVSKSKFLSTAIRVMPVLSIIAVIGWLFYWPIYVPLLVIVVNISILNRYKVQTREIREYASENCHTAKVYVSQIEMLENEQFASSKLQSLKSYVNTGDGSKASGALAEFGKYCDFLEASNNPYFYLVMNWFFLSDLIQIKRIESWKSKHQGEVENWIRTVYELEALASIAGYYHINPTFHFPEITDRPFVYHAKALGHPLIKTKDRVLNDFESEGAGVVKIITGSNMSGKSTFLRTLGINGVLAFSGAPVCAENCCISVMDIFTSMRTKDSLQENTSSFYAELKRLRQLLELVGKGTKVFFMLDEILKGTNSADRHNGAMALVRQLKKEGVSGLVSTHDLELASLEEEDPQHISNLNFSSDIKDGELFFDYKLKEGVCTSFNASLLMKKMGINME